jgi:hypothetical protein
MKNDEEIISEFIFVENHDSFCPIKPCRWDNSKIVASPFNAVQIYVCTIFWTGPHTTEYTWELDVELPEDSSEEEIQASISKLLNRKKYFKVCNKCNERNPDGWMESSDCCMGCASKYYNVVY